jgi:hypothetical protein
MTSDVQKLREEVRRLRKELKAEKEQTKQLWKLFDTQRMQQFAGYPGYD